MSKWQAKKIELKVYFEGVEVPANSVQLMEQAGSLPRCSVQIPINESILDIETNTIVHVFYKDTYTYDWILIFEGETAGYNLTKSSETRAVNVECVALAHHWKYALKGGITEVIAQNQINSKVNMIFQGRKSPKNTSNDGVNKTDVDEFHNFLDDINLSGISEGLKDDKESLSNKVAFDILFNQYSAQKIQFTGLIDTFIKSLPESTSHAVRTFVRGLSDVFAKAGAGYIMFHIVYKLAGKIFDFDNSKLADILQASSSKDYLDNVVANIPNNTNFDNFLNKLLGVFNYSSIHLSAPTIDESTGYPMSVVLAPTPTLFSPIACNTIFKDDVTNAGFSRSFLNEPTRYAGYTYPTNFTGDYAASIVVSPSTELHYDPTELHAVDLMLTRKERMGGVRGAISPNDFDEFKAYRDANASDGSVSDLLIPLRERYVDMEYNAAVLGSRGFSLNTTYSPYRICGLPGLFVDDKLSSVTGVVSSITSTISADGTSVSSINFKYPTPILPNKNVNNGDGDLDYWLEKSGVDSKTRDNETLLKNRWPFSENQEVVLSTGEKVTLDGKNIKTGNNALAWVDYLKYRLDHKDDLTFLPTWFDSDKYFPSTIGAYMYRTLMYGIEDTGSTPNIDNNGPKQIHFTKNNSGLDGSIGRYRDEVMTFGTGLYTNMENTNYVGHFLDKLLTQYRGATDPHEFIEKFTRRNIITEKEYWNFFLDQDSPDGLENLDKPTNLSGNYYGMGIRSVTDSVGNERSLVKQLKTISSNQASAPFIKERREIIQRIVTKLKGNRNYYTGT